MAKTKPSTSASTEIETRELTYIEAVNAALFRALEEVPEAIVFGEDVGKPGGVFGATRGLREKFGDRVFDTPISESAIIGAAIGSAMMGRRPIAEIMWADFSLVAMDQIINQASNVRYVSNGRLQAPMTIRTQQGVLSGSVAQHSQSLEAIFAHVPGLLVGMPATAQDAYDMLLAAVYADDPTIVIENRGLYFGPKQEVRLGADIQKVGGARIVKKGTDATLVSWGRMLHTAVEAAELLGGEGIGVEVIDARWLLPFDTATVLASVEKTHRVVIAHEANLTGGFGAEVAARIADEGLFSLDAPVCRVGVPDCRIPAAPGLQDALVPDAQSIVRAVRRAMHLEEAT
jgi:pyruvate dehydrogenase E1 component beta subunit